MSEKSKKKGPGRPKKKKVEEEAFQEEEQSDINEADDTFGLPEIDLKPLDEVEEEKTEEQPEEVQDEVVENQKNIDSDFEEPVRDFENVDEGDKAEADSDSDSDEKEKPSESFSPKFEYKEESSVAPKIIMAIVGVVLIVAGIYYFGFYAPQQKAEAEQIALDEAEAQKIADADRQAKLERDRLAAEQATADESAEDVVETTSLEPGEINILTEASGRYYVVIGSFIDDDLAMDYAKKLAVDGVTSVILSPPGSTKFYRVALSDYGSWTEAQETANGLKSNYSDELWVLKY